LADLYELMQRDGKPHIVAGDFNVFWGDREIRLFLAATGLRSANKEALPTFPSWAPKRELDFILYSEGLKMTSFERPEVRLSDHMPLVCDFELT
jgi:endonuclease/exonuclease/phosphatase (EEP) superfamily protein YafD